MQVTANNVANVSTPEFQASRARFEDGPGGQGVRISHLDVDHSPGPYQLETMPGGLEYVEGSNVDIGREMVDLILTGKRFFRQCGHGSRVGQDHGACGGPQGLSLSPSASHPKIILLRKNRPFAGN